MAVHLDLESLERSLADTQARHRPNIEAPGLTGVHARIHHDVLPALTRFRAKEVNNNSDPNEVAQALLSLFASTLVSEATAVNGKEIGADHYGFINRFLQALGEEVGEMFEGGDNYHATNIPATTVGSA